MLFRSLSSLLLIAEVADIEKMLVIVFVTVGSALLLGTILVLLFKFGFKRTKCKRQLKELDKKCNYLKGLLTGQDA